MDAMNSNLKEILKEVTTSAADVAAASTQLTGSTKKLAQGATEQVEKAAQIAAGSVEMNAATVDIDRNSGAG